MVIYVVHLGEQYTVVIMLFVTMLCINNFQILF